MSRPVIARLPTLDFFQKGQAVKGFKGAMVFAPSNMMKGSFEDRFRLVSQAESPKTSQLDHDQLLMTDSNTGRYDMQSFRIKQVVTPKKGTATNSQFIGGYRAFFTGDRDSKSIEVSLDNSHTFGPLRSLSAEEDPTREWNQALDTAAESTFDTFKRYFPNQNLEFKAMPNSNMDEFVSMLNMLSTLDKLKTLSIT